MALVNILEASRLIGKSRSPIFKAIKDGSISTQKDETGRTVIDTSELFRVFGPLNADNGQNTGIGVQDSQKSKGEQGQNTGETGYLLQLLAAERAKAEILAETVEDLRQRLDKETEERREAQARVMGLLTHRPEKQPEPVPAPALEAKPETVTPPAPPEPVEPASAVPDEPKAEPPPGPAQGSLVVPSPARSWLSGLSLSKLWKRD